MCFPTLVGLSSGKDEFVATQTVSLSIATLLINSIVQRRSRSAQYQGAEQSTMATTLPASREDRCPKQWPVPLAQQRTVLAVLFFTYASCLLCRANLDVSIPFLKESSILTADQAKFTLSCGIMAYTFAKLGSGIIADKIGGKRTLLLALLVISVSNLGLGMFGQSFESFVLLWGALMHSQGCKCGSF